MAENPKISQPEDPRGQIAYGPENSKAARKRQNILNTCGELQPDNRYKIIFLAEEDEKKYALHDMFAAPRIEIEISSSKHKPEENVEIGRKYEAFLKNGRYYYNDNPDQRAFIYSTDVVGVSRSLPPAIRAGKSDNPRAFDSRKDIIRAGKGPDSSLSGDIGVIKAGKTYLGNKRAAENSGYATEITAGSKILEREGLPKEKIHKEVQTGLLALEDEMTSENMKSYLKFTAVINSSVGRKFEYAVLQDINNLEKIIDATDIEIILSPFNASNNGSANRPGPGRYRAILKEGKYSYENNQEVPVRLMKGDKIMTKKKLL